ncbi:MAG: type II toxin-antitoxin system VapC family toxin [Myxococcales bacterium]|nr:MAG: type II toxin-antitoxin system VapC family toxin [Myxococcales bacterium]
MAVDTSALVAIILGEADAERLARVLQTDTVALTAASLFEASMVVESRQGPDGARDLRSLLGELDVQIVAVDAEMAQAAHQAWQRFGKGRHPAGLNFGDCFSYALAKTWGVPLLFKGNDFTQTDVASAL